MTPTDPRPLAEQVRGLKLEHCDGMGPCGMMCSVLAAQRDDSVHLCDCGTDAHNASVEALAQQVERLTMEHRVAMIALAALRGKEETT